MADNQVKFVYVNGAVTSDQVSNFDADTIYFVAGANGVDPKIYKGSTIFANAGDLATLRTQIGSLPVDTEEYDDLIDYIDKQIAAGDLAITNSLADVATSGTAADVAVVDADNNFTGDNVEDILAEIADNLSDGVDSKTIYLTDNGSTNDYAKVYNLYQGEWDPADSTVTGYVAPTLIGTINIPKDKVVEDGAVVNITFDSADNKLKEGETDVTALILGTGTPTAADAGKYIKLTLENVTDPLYIAAQDLVDIYTPQANATQVQLAVSSANEISASIVAGSIGETELTTSAVTSAKIADNAVTASKIDIAAHSETQTAGADGLSLTVTTTDGQVSGVSGSIAANTYDEYGAAASAVAALDATVSATGTPSVSGTMVITSITETDGVLTSVVSTEVEAAGAAANALSTAIGTVSDSASADTIYGAKAYADSAVTAALTWGSLS